MVRIKRSMKAHPGSVSWSRDLQDSEHTLGRRHSLRFMLVAGLSGDLSRSVSESTPGVRSAKAASRSPLILTLIYNGTFSNAALPGDLKNTRPFN